MTEKLKCALIYDFDGTLAEGDCPEHGLMPALGISDTKAFWREVKRFAKADDGDEILSYMGLLAAKAANKKSEELSIENLKKHGATIPLFPGVTEWFSRINARAHEQGLDPEHYILSSGLDGMIRGTAIGHEFRDIFACKYHYSADGKTALWPAQAINYTTKTQFLFRINKGIHNSWDNVAVNQFIEQEERAVQFRHMIYFGDGDTDIPAMKMVRYQGGFSLAVFDQKKWGNPETQNKVGKLIAEERANYVVPANYEEGSQLDVTVKGLLQLFRRKR
ncbi:haloacid dehalogenase-like hydrolase [Morganella morganii]|uniref:haloacid dehalogenase-like hydrolase n=1 Tax=Morganella morganii TaxID=582 RepID=UPI00164CACB7|nr:haloacid dehalogenase-like hydrolase [Morganella morganii]MBC4010661.1 haloacid dehalogenase-like hydrolase [Morganella morganii]